MSLDLSLDYFQLVNHALGSTESEKATKSEKTPLDCDAALQRGGHRRARDAAGLVRRRMGRPPARGDAASLLPVAQTPSAGPFQSAAAAANESSTNALNGVSTQRLPIDCLNEHREINQGTMIPFNFCSSRDLEINCFFCTYSLLSGLQGSS